jgi:hypothetical protein
MESLEESESGLDTKPQRRAPQRGGPWRGEPPQGVPQLGASQQGEPPQSAPKWGEPQQDGSQQGGDIRNHFWEYESEESKGVKCLLSIWDRVHSTIEPSPGPGPFRSPSYGVAAFPTNSSSICRPRSVRLTLIAAAATNCIAGA